MLRPNLLLFLMAIVCRIAFSQSENHRLGSIITDYSVENIQYSNGYALLSGSFGRAGTYSGSAVLLDQSTGVEDRSWPVISGEIAEIIPDGNGGFYAGGYFYGVDNEDVGNLVHILPNKTLDRSWLPSRSGSITSMALRDGILYVGGTFVSMNDESRYYAAAFNTATGELTDWNPHPNNRVTSIEVTNNVVYIAGLFSSINNGAVTRGRIAAVNKTNGNVIASWSVALGGAAPTVETLEASANTLYIGGYFQTVNAVSRNGVAAVHLSDGALVASWDAQPEMASGDPRIYTLLLDGSTLYIGGNFNAGLAGDNTVRHLGAVSATSTAAPVTSFKPVLNTFDQIHEMALRDNTLYVQGAFGEINGVDRYGLAALDKINGVPTSWNPIIEGTEVHSITFTGPYVILGGQISGVNWELYNGLAIVDESLGTLWPHPLEVGSGDIRAMIVKDNTMYIGGSFTTVNGVSRKNLAAIDLATGTVLPWNPGAYESLSTFDNTRVTALAASANAIYVAGVFRKVAGQNRFGLAAIDATTGIVTSWNPGVGDGTTMDQYISSMDINNNVLYAAGSFTMLAGESQAFLGGIDLTSGELILWDPAATAEVSKVRISGASAYVLGDFAKGIGGQIRPEGIAAIDLNTGLATNWNPQFSSTAIMDFTLTATDIYVGSYFDTADGQNRPGLASFSLATGELNAWDPDLGSALEGNYDVQTIAASPVRLYVGGSFLFMGNEYRRAFAEYDLVDPVDPEEPCTISATISLTGSTLTAQPGYTYQWFENDVLVQGATGQSYEIDIFEYGKYAVEITSNVCTIRSQDYIYLVTSDETVRERTLKIFPNPVRSELNIHDDRAVKAIIVDVTGKPVANLVLSEGTGKIDTSSWPVGLYIINVQSDHGMESIKVIKTK